MKKLLLVLMMCFSTQIYALEVEGVKLNDALQLDKHAVVLSGTGLRTKFFIKVYVAALYLDEKRYSAAAVFENTGAKRMLFHMLRDVSGKQMLDAINDVLPANHNSEEMKALEARLNDFTKLFASVNELKKNQEVAFDYIPGVGTRILIDGIEKGKFEGADFYTAMLKVWLGEKPAQGDMKRTLLGGK